MILKEFTSNDGTKLTKLTQALTESHINIDWENMTANRATRIREQATNVLGESADIQRRLKMNMVVESIDLWMKANIQTELTDTISEAVDDDSVEEAKVILAAKDISDKLQSMIEDVAQMQVQDLLPIVDSMRSELGSDEASTFSSSADATLGSLLESLKSCKEEYDNAIAVAQGESQDVDMDMDMGNIDDVDPGAGNDVDMDMDIDMDVEPDEFEVDDSLDDLDMDDDIDAGRELK